MKLCWSDKVRSDYRVYLEPVLATAASHMAERVGCRTRSRYLRRAVIIALIRDGYPLGAVSGKFLKYEQKLRGVSS